MSKVLVATRNPGKLREYLALFHGTAFEITDLNSEGIDVEISETGSTFAENATLKAIAYSGYSSLPVVADDSGLEVDALGGEPGVNSARYAGPEATDQQRTSLLVRKLEGVPIDKRTARFRAVIAVADKGRTVGVFEGTCEGLISLEPAGVQGFGYDPVFYVPELGKTMAELSMDEKNRLSHRGKAASQTLEFLNEYLSR